MLQNFGYYTFLGLSYALAIFLWAILYKSFAKNLYAVQDEPEKDKPWLDLGFLLLAGIATILIGQLYTAGQLLPELQWDNLKISECLNQIIIFSPFLLYFFLKKHPGYFACLPSRNWLPRLGIGLVLGILAIGLFSLLSQKRPFPAILSDVYSLSNTHFAIQIFLEDLVIGMLLAAWSRALGEKYFIWSLMLVAAIFAYGHLPANLAEGIPLQQALLHRSFDALLAIGILFYIFKSKDILWFWPIHFAMDMMQFYSGVPYH